MEIILTFLISVMAEVVSHLICKWLETSPSALGDPPRSGQAKLDNLKVITSLIKNQELPLLVFLCPHGHTLTFLLRHHYTRI